ncbi:hypothetical protein [Pelagibacterium sp. H642]|uniref:hypothetical protein n=1 Tax=Pelagibacterium sp. H642 TaxID=1881069 RepID=UPI002815FD6D|nr:hypothetical protein [Pelagibacterium sp. H642]WMT92581.1 hypothetical protein NO934_19740 [Pelagibacterium sp. H642]
MSETEPWFSPPTPGGAIDFCSLELTAPVAAAAIAQIFGERAQTIAAWCAIAARQEGDDARYRLWLETFKRLRADSTSAID